MSWGVAVACQVGADVFVGTVVVAVGVGVWISSLRVRDWGVSLSASGSTCAGVAHSSDAGVSVSMPECSGAGSAHSSFRDSGVSVSMPEYIGAGSAHSPVLESGVSVSMPERIGAGSAHRSEFASVVGRVSSGGSADISAGAAAVAADSLADLTMSLQSMLSGGSAGASAAVAAAVASLLTDLTMSLQSILQVGVLLLLGGSLWSGPLWFANFC